MSTPRSSRFAVATLSLGSCSSHRLENKLRAAAQAGFKRLELFLPDLEAYIEAHEKQHNVTRSTVESRHAACRDLWSISKELGLTYNSLQPLRDVEGIRDPVKKCAKFDEVTSYFPICNIFEIDLLFCCSSIQPDASNDVAVISKDLVELADLAVQWHKKHGGPLIRIGYEGLSWGTHINKWSQAWHCVNYDPRPNLGLIVDSFNALAREYADPFNPPTGLQRSPAQSVIFLRQHLQHLTSTVPGNKIFLFQIADASMPPKALSRPPSPESGVPRLQPWSRNTRLFPLETERGAYLPVVPYVKAVLATGYQGDLSLEVFNATLHDTDENVPQQHARRAYAALTKLDQTLEEAAQVSESTKGIERPESPCRVRNSPRSALTPLPPAATAGQWFGRRDRVYSSERDLSAVRMMLPALPLMRPGSLLLKPRIFMERFTNYFARGFLNRASWLRQDVKFLEEQCKSPQARFLVLNEALNPLVKREASAQNVGSAKELVKKKLEVVLATLEWNDISSFFLSDEQIFASTEPSADLAQQPQLIFLGIDERDATETDDATESTAKASKKQKSLPTKKPDEDTSFQPSGPPYFAIDASKHPELAKKALEVVGGEENALFIDLRAELLCLDFESTGVIAAARALADWNKRNRFCPACGNETGSVWGGWKRACLPDQPHRTPDRPPCVSKKGVHNFAYPRTDPVVIMAIQSHDGKELLLGRNKSWPAGFFSCLAGFTEPGESIEESVKREVWEEAGVRVSDVSYHSSQPWPFPGSLMLGCIGTAEPDTHIRLDLDNELESAAFYPYETVAAALAASDKTGLSRHEVSQIQQAQDNAETAKKDTGGKDIIQTSQGKLRIPPKTAIAHVLIRAWVESKQAQSGKSAGKTEATQEARL